MLVKAFRLFVSSTFADFVQERELLQSKVFPALDAYCAARGYQFLPLDLRWGVSQEAQLDQRTAEICLGEVRAAKDYPPPNFLIMIGNRYGWVPLPYAIARDEFEVIVAWLRGHWKWGAARALRTAYQHDENHLVSRGLVVAEPAGDELVSAYTLRSREDDIPELKPSQAWGKFEARLRRSLQEAADQLLKLGRIDAAAHEKYFLSVTEQEIILGLHGYNHGRATSILPASPATDGLQATAFIREIAGNTSDGRGPPPEYIEQGPRLDVLKDRIKRALPGDSIATARGAFDKGGKLDEAYLADFATSIQRKLEAAIDRHIALVSAVEQALDFALQGERDEHHAFAVEKRKVFVGRGNNLASIASYIAGGDDHPLILHGRSGLGKSALMASAIAAAEAAGSTPVIYRFIGARAASSDFRSMLVSLVEDLAAHGIGQKPDEFEQDANKFSDQIMTVLSSITEPVLIFLDALDQLRKPYRLGWLPKKLPTAMKLVVSVLDDEAYETDSGVYRTLRQRLAPDAFLEIEPLEAMDAREILTALESDAKRRLQASQRDYIIGQFEKAGGSPLYLRTAFEIASSWRSSDTAGKGQHVLADDTAALIAQLIRELSDVHHHKAELVTRTLGYLTAAKDGLSAKELTDVLSRDRAVMQAISSEKHGARTDQLPASVWVRLNRQLAPFLTEKRIDDQPLLQFFHRQVAQVAREQHYETAKSGKAALHAALADYFDTRCSTRDGEPDRAFYVKRSLSELPYQLHHAGNTARLDQVLLSPDWMQQKLGAFDPQTLVADYEQFGRSQMQNFIGRTLRLTTGICARDPRQLLPQLLGRLMACADPAAPAFLNQARSLIRAPALLPQRLSLTPPGAETARLEGHTGSVNALAVLEDGCLASGSDDNTIRLWDVKSGAETARLEGHTGSVNALAVLEDGCLASGSDDNTVRLWDIKSGTETARFEVLTDSVSALAILPGGRLALGLRDATIQLCHVNIGAGRARLEGHTDWVMALAVLPDGRLASGSEDKTIRLWDVNSGTETARLEGHTGSVNALAVLENGRLASGSDDNTIRLWDVKSGTETARLEGHDEKFRALAALPDGRLASGSLDPTIRLWDPATGTETARLEGHTNWVAALAVLPDGRLASCSGPGDYSIRLWDLKSSADSSELEGHNEMLTALAVLPDGRLALASAPGDNSIRLCDANNRAETGRLKGHAAPVVALAVLPDGRLASNSMDGTIRLWDVNSGAETSRHKGAIGAMMNGGLALLPDGRLAWSVGDFQIRLCDVSTGGESAWPESDDGPTDALAMLPDGRLASGSGNNTIRLWDVKSGSETARLAGHDDMVLALAVLPNGRLASASFDRTIRVWHVGSGAEIARLEGDAPVSCLTVLPDGCLLAGDQMGRLHTLKVLL